MDVDTASDNTSIDDKIDDFCENPTRDALTEGLMSLLKPTVDQLDERIRATRYVTFFFLNMYCGIDVNIRHVIDIMFQSFSKYLSIASASTIF